jgi:hypothetical protein
MDRSLVQQAELVDIAIGHHLNSGNAFEVRRIAEEMGVAFLELEVFGNGDFVPDRVAVTTPSCAAAAGKAV